MLVKQFIMLRDEGSFAKTPEWQKIDQEIRAAIAAVHWPVGSGTFTVNPIRRGNGVVPIKDGFVASLVAKGWATERRALIDGMGPGPIDALKDFQGPEGLATFICEWETGNVSSSHRAMNKIVVALKEDNIIGGCLVLPERALAQYLTDRIGNFEELEPYFPLWEEAGLGGEGLVGVYVVGHDAESPAVPTIPKGTDGRARI